MTENEMLKRQLRHMAKVAWWYACHTEGQEVPEWCELTWCHEEPVIYDDLLQMSEQINLREI